MPAEEYKGMRQEDKPGHIWYVALLGWHDRTGGVAVEEELDIYATSKQEARKFAEQKLKEDYEGDGMVMDVVIA